MSESMVWRYKEASDWLLRLNRDDPPENEVAAWLRWCEADERNLKAFERMQSDWGDVERLREDAGFVASEAWTVRKARASHWSWRLAAGIALFAVIAGTAFMMRPRGQEISAGTSNKTTVLPDGSSLTLRAQAAVSVSFDERERRLDMGKGSEAYFKVRHDPSRPFIVRAGELTVTAVGTAFDIKREARRTSVTVEEGKVSISAGDHAWLASAGQRVEYAGSPTKVAVARVDAGNALRWRQGEFAYVKAPLGAVIDDINRYSPRRLTIGDEGVRAIPYTGTVFAGSIDDWLAALTMKYPVRTVTSSDGQITLEARDAR